MYNKNVQAVLDSSAFISANTNHVITALYFDYSDMLRYLNLMPSSGVSNNKKFNPALDNYYSAQANIDLLNIKDWFITSAIMEGFRNYSFEGSDLWKYLTKRLHQYISIILS